MLPAVQDLTRELEKILLRCADALGASAAALYMLSADGDSAAVFERVAHFGFKDESRLELEPSDSMVERLLSRKSAFFVNDVSTSMSFAEMMPGASADRMLFRAFAPLLAVPLYGRGRVIGFIDLRNGEKRAFNSGHTDRAKAFVGEMMKLLIDRNVFGLAPLTPTPRDKSGEIPIPPLPPDVIEPPPSDSIPPPPGREATAEPPADVLESIQVARLVVAREAASVRAEAEILRENDLSAVRLILPGMLNLSGAVLACFTAIGQGRQVQLIASRATITEPALRHFTGRLEQWLKRRGDTPQLPRPEVYFPLGNQGAALQPAHVASVLSAPVSVASVRGLVLSVAFETTPDARTKQQLSIYLQQIEQTLHYAVSYGALLATRQNIAEKLLEPDFQRHPELLDHCRGVSDLAGRFAHSLELSHGEREAISLAAFVHDVGMRLLSYRDLYTDKEISVEEMKVLREHPIVGAAIVEPVLGWDIANVVLSHHERVDGKGYPHGISGFRIPLAARIIQICDAYHAMTESAPYREPVPPHVALERLRQDAGHQFDADLTGRFSQMILEADPLQV